ncbi:MAG: hypothetical protein WAX69_26970 [Victivallales bacterium]
MENRIKQTAQALKDAYEAFNLAGIQATSEDIRALAITFLIDEGKMNRIAGLTENREKKTNVDERAPVKVPEQKPKDEPQEAKPATNRQIKFLLDLCKRTNSDLKEYLKRFRVSNVYDLDMKQATSAIDDLKARATA